MTSNQTIVITGFMGCGKTEVARCLAQHLNVQLHDLDKLIAEREGRTAAQLIREQGERVFRTIETETLRSLLSTPADSVIALGGGAWIESNNRDLLDQSGALSVWLDVPFEVCWDRIKVSAEDRPLGSSEEQARELYGRRLPIYALARVRVKASAADEPEKLALFIATECRSSGCR